MKTLLQLALLTWLLVLIPLRPARAWWPTGHSIITAAALKSLPDSVPQFLRGGAWLTAHCAQDPDVAKNRGVPELKDREEPDHYLDLELLGGRPLPDKRSSYIALCGELKLSPSEVGYLPYSIAEGTGRLAMALAEYRRWPDQPAIQYKALVYAGLLSHYSGDLEMPLHVTVDHDGRARHDRSSPRTGIHARMDSLIEKLGFTPETLSAGVNPVVLPFKKGLVATIMSELGDCRKDIGRVYQWETALPPTTGGAATPWVALPEVRALGLDRGRAGARFTASLFLTAWEMSAVIKLPDWLQRIPAPDPTLNGGTTVESTPAAKEPPAAPALTTVDPYEETLSAPDPVAAAYPSLQSVLWMQSSAEYSALVQQTFRQARDNLTVGLRTPQWSALRQTGSALRRAPAVICDLDETLFDNAPYNGRMLKEQKNFDQPAWQQWAASGRMQALPGALAFTSAAAQRKVAIFYISNRKAGEQAVTLANLKRLGFPDASDAHLLLQDEHPSWTNDKSSRRQWVASRYRVLLLLGDDLGDFLPVGKLDPAQRRQLMSRHQDYWGQRWFVLPNPVYGSWERALLGPAPLTPSAQLARKLAAVIVAPGMKSAPPKAVKATAAIRVETDSKTAVPVVGTPASPKTIPVPMVVPSPSTVSIPASAPVGGGAGTQVWVNLRSRKYFLPGNRYYGKTVAGRFMTEASARAQGYHPGVVR